MSRHSLCYDGSPAYLGAFSYRELLKVGKAISRIKIDHFGESKRTCKN